MNITNGYKRSRQEKLFLVMGTNGLYFPQWLRCLERGHDPTYKDEFLSQNKICLSI